MTLTIKTKKETECKKRKFGIYHHELSLKELDDYILEIMLEDEQKLNQLFEAHNKQFDDEDRENQLKRFIETKYQDNESSITDDQIREDIKNRKSNTYYSFFAEALLARLNIDYLDSKLITAVISTEDMVDDGKTGADVCMVSDRYLVHGEAKFYKDLSGGVDDIIKDTSFEHKLKSYINKVKSPKKIILKNILNGQLINEETGEKKTEEEIKKLKFIFTGFVLHNAEKKEKNYHTQYEKINGIQITNMPQHFEVHLYHLPIQDKWDLVFKAQRKALDLIIELKKNKA